MSMLDIKREGVLDANRWHYTQVMLQMGSERAAGYLLDARLTITARRKCLRMTQPMLLQSFQDEFDVQAGNDFPKTTGIL
jgi:hypothetical protein